MSETIQAIMPVVAQFAWPIVVLILCVVFRKQLARLIDRAEKVGVEGIQTAPRAQEQAKDMAPSKSGELLNPFLSPLLVEKTQKLREELDKVVSSPKDREDVLLRALASNQITLNFEKTYSSIFGSQITALQQLNGAPDSAADLDAFRRFYDQAKLKHSDFYSNYPFEGWLNFLQQATLIQVDGGKVNVTVRGKEFLKYVIDQGHPLVKFG